MILQSDLYILARARLADARALLKAGRYDSAAYLSGYAVEIALKARICRTLKWTEGFPSTAKDFDGLQSFKTHNLDILLMLSGNEDRIKHRFVTEWSRVLDWSPEWRYRKIGSITPDDTQRLIDSAARIVRAL